MIDVDGDPSYEELSDKMLSGFAAQPPITMMIRVLCREINRLNQRLDAHQPAKPKRVTPASRVDL